jgi:TolA-binding protein
MSEQSFHYFDELDAYFQNRMSEQERVALLQRVQKDTQLREEFEVFQQLVYAARAEGNRTLLEQIRQQHQKAKSRSLLQKPRTRKLVVWAAAAAIAALLAAGIWWYRSEGTYTELIARHYDAESKPLQSLLDSLEMLGFAANRTADDQRYLNILLLVEAGQYADALPALQRWHQEHPADTSALFLLAMCELATGAYQASAEKFAPLASAPGMYQQTAEFHQALALLGLRSERKRGMALLQQIAEQARHPYQLRARQLIDS